MARGKANCDLKQPLSLPSAYLTDAPPSPFTDYPINSSLFLFLPPPSLTFQSESHSPLLPPPPIHHLSLSSALSSFIS